MLNIKTPLASSFLFASNEIIIHKRNAHFFSNHGAGFYRHETPQQNI